MSKSRNDSRKRSREEPVVSVAYSGEEHSFSAQAAKTYFENVAAKASNIQYSARPKTVDVFDSVKDGTCAYGVLPLESSSSGTIHLVYDYLLRFSDDVGIIGEIGCLEKICVFSRSDQMQDLSITKVYGRADILQNCSEYLDALDSKRKSRSLPSVQRVGSSSAAQRVIEASTEPAIALCSREVGELNGLTLLQSNVSNDRNAQTRYIIIAKKSANGSLVDILGVDAPDSATRSRQRAPRKSSIVVALKNVPGSIFKMSSCFALRDMDILKIESRPASTALGVRAASGDLYTSKHWNLIFYVDFEPSASEEVNSAAIRNLQDYALWLKILGSYEAGLRDTVAEPHENWNDMLFSVSMT
jgi:chorismate mutase/prephenate dehydratase